MNQDANDAALAHQQQLESEQMNKISAALVRAQKAFSPALKTSTNPHFKNRYAALDACVEAVMDALNNEGIFLMQRTHHDNDGVTVETVFVHESGEQLSGGLLNFPATKADAQGYMSTLTYARRGSLMAACGIAPEDDDGEASRKAPKAPPFDIDGARSALVACGDIAALKEIFAKVYKAAPSAMQREAVKAVYEAVKLQLTTVTPTQGE
jgi:hypothetical protein